MCPDFGSIHFNCALAGCFNFLCPVSIYQASWFDGPANAVRCPLGGHFSGPLPLMPGEYRFLPVCQAPQE